MRKDPTFKTFLKDFNNKKVLYFIKELENGTDFILVEKINGQLYCWLNSSCKKLGLEEVHNFCQYENNVDTGYSSDNLADLEYLIPNIMDFDL